MPLPSRPRRNTNFGGPTTPYSALDGGPLYPSGGGLSSSGNDEAAPRRPRRKTLKGANLLGSSSSDYNSSMVVDADAPPSRPRRKSHYPGMGAKKLSTQGKSLLRMASSDRNIMSSISGALEAVGSSSSSSPAESTNILPPNLCDVTTPSQVSTILDSLDDVKQELEESCLRYSKACTIALSFVNSVTQNTSATLFDTSCADTVSLHMSDGMLEIAQVLTQTVDYDTARQNALGRAARASERKKRHLEAERERVQFISEERARLTEEVERRRIQMEEERRMQHEKDELVRIRREVEQARVDREEEEAKMKREREARQRREEEERERHRAQMMEQERARKEREEEIARIRAEAERERKRGEEEGRKRAELDRERQRDLEMQRMREEREKVERERLEMQKERERWENEQKRMDLERKRRREEEDRQEEQDRREREERRRRRREEEEEETKKRDQERFIAPTADDVVRSSSSDGRMDRRARARVQKKSQFIPETPLGEPAPVLSAPLDHLPIPPRRQNVQPVRAKRQDGIGSAGGASDADNEEIVGALRRAVQKPLKRKVSETPSRDGRVAPPRRARNTNASQLLKKHRRGGQSEGERKGRKGGKDRIHRKDLNDLKGKSEHQSSERRAPPTKARTKKRVPPRIVIAVDKSDDGNVIAPVRGASTSASTPTPVVPERGGSSTRSRKTKAQYTFDAQNSDELDFLEGDDILVLKQLDQGWSDGMNLRTRKRGIFPTTYVH